jgi:hypothetical protein
MEQPAMHSIADREYWANQTSSGKSFGSFTLIDGVLIRPASAPARCGYRVAASITSAIIRQMEVT